MKIKMIKAPLKYRVATLWQFIYRAEYAFRIWQARHAQKIIAALLIVYIWLAWVLEPHLQAFLEKNLLTENANALEGIQNFLLALGSALIGGSAIAFSLVMFAMQVNVERMPHGLFRKFSSDWRLIWSFLLTLILSILISSMSLIPNPSWSGTAIIVALIATIFIFSLFLYAYKRALSLINPVQQLNMIVVSACKIMQAWSKRAERARALFQTGEAAESEKTLLDSFATHDTPRTAYLKINSHWTQDALSSIQNIISFSRRYAEQGDHEVSAAALTAILVLNQNYISVKGKTFFTNPAFFDNPFSTDNFINETLEHLRQNIRYAGSRGDERQIEQTFEAFNQLIRLYLTIDYSTSHGTKYHADIAKAYFAEAIQSVIPHNMPDVLMRGVSLLGGTAEAFIAYGQEAQIADIADKICLVGAVGIINEKHQPVLLTAVDQLAKMTFSLLRAKSADIGFPAKSLKNNLSILAKSFLDTPDTPLASKHQTYLAPYYSSTSQQSFCVWMTHLINSLLDCKEDDQDAKAVINNITEWADQLYISSKELFLKSIEKKSPFVFDVIHWITNITKILLALGNAPVCDEHHKESLEKHALWLVSVLDWVPDNKEATAFVEGWSFRESLLEASLDARGRGYVDVTNKIQDILFSWAFKAGKYQSGWGSLEYAIYALAAYALVDGNQRQENLKRKLSQRLSQEGPDRELLDRTARNIRREANSYRQSQYALRIVDRIMGDADHAQKQSLLLEIANILSPATQGAPEESDIL